MIKESRLIHRRASDFNVTQPVNRRRAQQNAAYQQQQHAEALSQPAQVQTYIGSDGKDVRFDYNQYDVRDYDMARPDAPMQTATINGPINGGYAQQANQGLTSPFAGSPTPTDPRNPSGYVAPGSAESLKTFAAQRRNERLKAMGLNPDDEIIKLLDQGATFSGSTGGRSTFKMPDGSFVTIGEDANIGQQAAEIYGHDYEGEITQEQEQKKQEQQQKEMDALGSTMTDPLAQGMAGFLQNLPPEAQYLAPFFQNVLSTIQQTQSENAANTEALLNGGTLNINGQDVPVSGIASTYKQMETKVQDMEAGYTAMQESIQGMLDKAKEQQDKYISQQEEAAKQRLDWNEMRQLRQTKENERKAVENRIARLALTGGFGSDGGLREIEEVKSEYEKQISNIQTEFGIQRTELAAKFTGLFTESTNNYINSSIQNIKETASNLERVAGQSMTLKQNRLNAETTILNNFIATQTTARKEYAGTLKDYATQMVNMVQQSKADKLQQQQNAWNQLIQAKTLFGSNVPESLITSLAKNLPGVNVAEVVKAKTWTETKDLMGDIQDAAYTDVISEYTPQDSEISGDNMSLVIDRVARQFGRTKDERLEYKQRYADLIASGKNQEEILANLKTDYWVSANGPVKTAHDARETTLAAITSIESILSKYGIEKGSDGSLGPVSSRWQGALSRVGLSSNEFNELSAMVGNLRADIIKDRYGAAVTPQELALAQSYIPDMNLKGDKFIENLNALKNHTQFLEDKYFAREVGLKEPQSPFGSDGGTTGNYGTDDILKLLGTGAGSTMSYDDGRGGPVTLPKEWGMIKTGYMNGTVTGYGSKYWKPGLDVAATKGSPIKTTRPGVVEKVVYNPNWKGAVNNAKVGMSQNGGFGNQVVVKYGDGVKLQFSHADKLPFGPEMQGKPVPAGAVIAYVGNTGNTYGKTGVHADITGYRPDGKLMTAKEVAEYLLRTS